MSCLCFGSGEAEPRFIERVHEIDELRGQLSAVMPPVEVGWGADAVVNVSRLPSLAPTRPADPLGTFQRRHSMSLAQQQQQGGEPAGGGGGRPGTDALQWTDSRKLLEAAIAIEQLTPIQEDAPAAAGWGWGAGGWGGTPLDAAEQRLQARLFKLKLEHCVMEGDGNCQFRSASFGLYGTPRHHGRVRAAAVAYMQQRRQDFEAFLGEEFPQYIWQMSQDGTWGDELTLRALCEALGVVVNVVTSDEANWFLRYIPRTTRPRHEIFVTYIAPVHYNALRRTNTGDRLRKSLGRQQGYQLARAVSTYQKRYGLPETPQHTLAAAAATGGG